MGSAGKNMVVWLIATVLCGLLYRAGGIGKPFNTKFRDLGVPLVCLGYIIFILEPQAWWVHLISFILLFGALTTYLDKIFKKDNFYAHGFICALSYLPYAINTGHYTGFFIRLAIVTLFMGWWCEVNSNDVVEETGRGGVILATLPLFSIF